MDPLSDAALTLLPAVVALWIVISWTVKARRDRIERARVLKIMART